MLENKAEIEDVESLQDQAMEAMKSLLEDQFTGLEVELRESMSEKCN